MIEYESGFFDGEGCITIPVDHSMVVEMDNSNFEILNIFRERFGGNIHKLKIELLDNGCGFRKQMWSWHIHSRKMISFLKIIEPYLFEKKEQCNLMIDYFNNYFVGSGNILSESNIKIREKYRLEFIKLKKHEFCEYEITKKECCVSSKKYVDDKQKTLNF